MQMAALMHYYEDADGNLAEQFQTAGFYARRVAGSCGLDNVHRMDATFRAISEVAYFAPSILSTKVCVAGSGLLRLGICRSILCSRPYVRASEW
jgi:hypothetical protein